MSFQKRLLVLTTQDRFFLTHIKDRALYFLQNGWLVGVAVQCTDQTLCEKIRALGFELFDTKIERQSINLFSELGSLFRIFCIYQKFNPDVVWHLGAKAIAYGTISAKLLRFRKTVGIVNAPIGLGYVFASQDLKARCLKPFLFCTYRFLLNPSNSKVIVENNDDIQTFIQWGALREEDAFCILGAGVDTKAFSPSNIENPFLTVMMASRLIREKGVWDFVRVAEILKRDKVPVRMVLVGEPDFGNPSSITRKEFRDIKNNPAIECWGFCEDMGQTLNKADVFCLPSFYREGLPRVLVEAASCGLVILTTDTVGCREVVRGNNGFLFKPHDCDGMANAICWLVKNASERKQMGLASRQIALKDFDSRIVIRETADVFNSFSWSN